MRQTQNIRAPENVRNSLELDRCRGGVSFGGDSTEERLGEAEVVEISQIIIFLAIARSLTASHRDEIIEAETRFPCG